MRRVPLLFAAWFLIVLACRTLPAQVDVPRAPAVQIDLADLTEAIKAQATAIGQQTKATQAQTEVISKQSEHLDNLTTAINGQSGITKEGFELLAGEITRLSQQVEALIEHERSHHIEPEPDAAPNNTLPLKAARPTLPKHKPAIDAVIEQELDKTAPIIVDHYEHGIPLGPGERLLSINDVPVSSSVASRPVASATVTTRTIGSKTSTSWSRLSDGSNGNVPANLRRHLITKHKVPATSLTVGEMNWVHDYDHNRGWQPGRGAAPSTAFFSQTQTVKTLQVDVPGGGTVRPNNNCPNGVCPVNRPAQGILQRRPFLQRFRR